MTWAAVRVIITLPVVFAFVAGRSTTTVSRVDESVIELGQPNNPLVVDVYGNQVDHAVGDYRVDPRGDLYERHAPDTAVLTLGPPSV